MSIYENIGKRTGGDIYIGVVGPVRAGKSTFIKRFMDLLVLPNVEDTYEKQRILDEMPQSGGGRTITTTEPKFIPAEAVRLGLGVGTGREGFESEMSLKLRLVDCVGYMVPGAIGNMEEDEVRLVLTPWSEERLPFEEAARIGTEKVIKDHSTVGIAVTSDGSIGTMKREDYKVAEERVIKQLKQLGKPFVVIMNSSQPEGEAAKNAAAELSRKFEIPVIRMDCARAGERELTMLLDRLLGRFPVKEVTFEMPGYIEGLDNGHRLKSSLIEEIRHWADSFETVDDIKDSAALLAEADLIEAAEIRRIDMGEGRVEVRLDMPEELYYDVVSELMDEQVGSDQKFFTLLREFSEAKKAYDKLRRAMEMVEDCGYGIVEPKVSEMTLEEPEVFRQGSKYGIKIKAKAPTLHIIKTDISTEVSPLVGSEKQAEDLVASLKEEMRNSPNGIWNTNIFGKTLREMILEQMENKIAAVPDTIRGKMQKSLQKISDEGKEYFICIVI